MSCCIQFLKWNALSLHFYSKNCFSKNIHYVMHLIFKNGINNIFPSQTSSLLLSSDTHDSFVNKPIKFCHHKPNTWQHIFAVIVYVLPSSFSYMTAFFCYWSFFQIQRAEYVSVFLGKYPFFNWKVMFIFEPKQACCFN